MGFFNKYPYTNFHELNLDWILDQVKAVVTLAESIDSRITTNETDIAELQTKVDELENTFDTFIENFKKGTYTDLYIDSLSSWIDTNLQKLVAKIAQFVQFSLSNDGYFQATIPTNWNFLTFDTDADTESDTYGCLILTY